MDNPDRHNQRPPLGIVNSWNTHNTNRREHTKPMPQVLQLILLCLNGDGRGEYRFTEEWRCGVAGMLCRGKRSKTWILQMGGPWSWRENVGLTYIIVGKQTAVKAFVGVHWSHILQTQMS